MWKLTLVRKRQDVPNLPNFLSIQELPKKMVGKFCFAYRFSHLHISLFTPLHIAVDVLILGQGSLSVEVNVEISILGCWFWNVDFGMSISGCRCQDVYFGMSISRCWFQDVNFYKVRFWDVNFKFDFSYLKIFFRYQYFHQIWPKSDLLTKKWVLVLFGICDWYKGKSSVKMVVNFFYWFCMSHFLVGGVRGLNSLWVKLELQQEPVMIFFEWTTLNVRACVPRMSRMSGAPELLVTQKKWTNTLVFTVAFFARNTTPMSNNGF